MARRRTTRFVVVSLAALLSVVFVPAAASAAVQEVTAPGQAGWHATVSTGTSEVGFVDGPATPPLNSGSARLKVDPDGNDAAQLRNLNYNGVELADLDELSYSTYTTQDGSGGQSPYLLLNIDHNGDTVLEDQLFFEPVYQSAVFFPFNPQAVLTTLTWQNWDALNGGWWSAFGTPGFSPGTGVGSLAAYVAAFPTARIVNNLANTVGGFRVVTGFGGGAWDNYDGNVDELRIAYDDGVVNSDITYDFNAPAAGAGDSVTGGSPTTSTPGTADSTNPVVTTVNTPVVGTTTITESGITQPAPSGFGFIGQQVDITTPPSTPGNPITITFTLDSSVRPDLDLSDIHMYKSGVEVPELCTDLITPAADPCVASKTLDGNGDRVFIVKTTSASPWNFGADNDPPEVHIDTPANGSITSDNTPTFSGAAGDLPDDLTTVQLRVWDVPVPAGPADYTVNIDRTADGDGNDARWTSDGTLSLPDGSYSAIAIQDDQAGNTGNSDSLFGEAPAFTVDTTAPTVSLTTPADGLETTDNSPEFAGVGGTASFGTAPAGISDDIDPVRVRIWDGTIGGTPDYTVDATRGGGGAYSTSGPYTRVSDSASVATLPDGPYQAQAYQDDELGNSGFAPEEPSFFIDTTSPTVSLTSTPLAVDNDNDPAFTWNAVDPAPSSGSTVTCQLNKTVGPAEPQTHGIGTLCPGGAISYTDLSDGTYRFRVRITDDVGHVATTPFFVFVIDTASPSVLVTDGHPAVSNDNDPHIEFSTSDPSPSSGGLTTDCELTGPEPSALAPCTSPVDFTDLEDGEYVFTVTVTDAAGNATQDAIAFMIDTVKPSVIILTPKPQDSNSTSATLDYRHSDFSDGDSPSSGVVTVECQLINSSTGPTPLFQPCGTGSPTGAVTDEQKVYTNLPEGEQIFTVRVTDGAGNVNYPPEETHTWWVDSQAPDTIIDSGPNQPWDNSDTATFTFHGEDPPPSLGGFTFQCRLDPPAGAWESCTSAKTYMDLAEGAHKFRVRAIDNAGNVDPTPATHNWSIDTVKPEINIEFPTQGGRYSMYKDDNLHADYSCSDPSPGSGLVPPPNDCFGRVQGHGPVADGDPIYNDAPGTYVFKVTSTDNAGNTRTMSITYHVFTFDGLINDLDPVGYYRMNDPAGSSVMADFSGNGNDGEYKNDQDSGPEGISGDGDFARAFFGDAGYGYVNGIAAPSRYTLSAFVKFDDVGDQAVLHHGGAGAIWLEDEEFHFRPVDWFTNVELVGGPPAPDLDGLVNPDVWYHVVGTMGGGKAKLFVNAVKMDEEGIAKATSGASTFYVGFGNLGLSRPWLRGSLDEVAYFGSDLSNQHIYEIWLADPPAKGNLKPADTEAGEDPDTLTSDEPGDKPGGGPDGDGGPDNPGDGPDGGGDGDGDDSEIQETQADGDDSVLGPAGTWVRADGSVIEIVAKKDKWIGKTILTAAKNAKKARSSKAKSSKKAKKPKRCGLKKGVATIALKVNGKGGYKGEILDPVKESGNCAARKAKVTATISEDGETMTLVKKRGKKRSTETLTRSHG